MPNPELTGAPTPPEIKARITVQSVKDRFIFLVDGKADASYDKSFGLTTYPSRELAQRAGEYYLRQRTQAFAFAAELLGRGGNGGGSQSQP
jgi:hypothetical protein